MPNYSYLIWIPLLPLLAFVLLGLFGRKYFRSSAGFIGTASLLASTILSFIAAKQYFFVDGKVNGIYQKITAFKYTWLGFSPGVSIDMSIIVDPVSVMMLVIVTFVSLMVHIFSLGYMKGEARFATYYAFLSLFTFSMLGLVLAGNLFQVYMFWELVGVSSFLLIGYYFEKPSAVAASKKAFIVTRFADLGFLIGILIIAFYGRSLDISVLIERLASTQTAEFTGIATAGFLGVSALTWGLTMIFIGGAGKSAMFPLHIWLPDAMEGPTPVSALIHAATMVVAGVYLVARLFPVFSMDGAVMLIITWVGAFSALLAAVIACTQTDIKRVLAYSTMSQIGYMMFALGISKQTGEAGLGYMASMFHLFTHAFFKSLLFLGAGAVIHFVHSNEMKDMGGLRRYMPVTHAAFLVGCLAIAGVPPFAGFFSKEEILLAAFHSNKAVYGVALFTAALTAFYMFRLYFSIFWNRTTEWHNTHGEGTASMKVPLVILALCALVVGVVPFPGFVTATGAPLETHTIPLFFIAPVALTVIAILVAALFYKNQSDKPNRAAAAFGALYRAAHRKFYMDELYLFVTRKVIFPLIGQPIAWIDKNIVDGLVNLSATTTVRISTMIKGIQSGRVQGYALFFFGGIAAFAILFIYLWK
ncbi:NADH-quinone oxidoreductase subunit L [Sediminibacterium roseum]|uniref:NADH-quinone oxidoreductase subunit L n=1 Tax=Sediminibacterium roseum TaxID=1978412 RepID=A0ABW9ZZH1_9BACT|nr:NADH-quinone oxidoreductase subunit L [Sediminibacterium roseum]NCI51433.1 NADH-quinone oxidoreductase subunit L [Sediminibacterium roseum]